LLTTGVVNVSGAHTGAVGSTATTYDDTGVSLDTFTGAGNAAAQTGTTTYGNMASSAQLDITGTVTNSHIGKLAISQVGTAASNFLTITTGTAAAIADALTITGAGTLLLNSGTAATYASLTDGGATNSLSKIIIAGAGATSITAITDSALTMVDATEATGAVTIGDNSVSGTSVAGMTFKASAAAATSITANGNGDTVTQAATNAAGTASTGAVTTSMSGSGDTISVLVAGGTGVGITASGAATKITVSGSGFVDAANGAGDTITMSGTTGTITAANGNGTTIILGTGTYTVTSASGAADKITIGSISATTGAGTATTNTVTASGAGDVITVNQSAAGQITLTASGAGDTITLTTGSTTFAGTSSTITAAGGGNTIDASGFVASGGHTLTIDTHGGTTGSSIKLGAYGIAVVGVNDVVTLSAAGNNQVDVSSAGAAAGAALTVLTTINSVQASDTIKFEASTTNFDATAVDVTAATSLSAALTLAAAAVVHHISWFQYGGNTYLVDNVAATTTALDATDTVVKLTGLVELGSATYSTNVVTI
jgi:S-layer protein